MQVSRIFFTHTLIVFVRFACGAFFVPGIVKNVVFDSVGLCEKGVSAHVSEGSYVVFVGQGSSSCANE